MLKSLCNSSLFKKLGSKKTQDESLNDTKRSSGSSFFGRSNKTSLSDVSINSNVHRFLDSNESVLDKECPYTHVSDAHILKILKLLSYDLIMKLKKEGGSRIVNIIDRHFNELQKLVIADALFVGAVNFDELKNESLIAATSFYLVTEDMCKLGINERLSFAMSTEETIEYLKYVSITNSINFQNIIFDDVLTTTIKRTCKLPLTELNLAQCILSTQVTQFHLFIKRYQIKRVEINACFLEDYRFLSNELFIQNTQLTDFLYYDDANLTYAPFLTDYVLKVWAVSPTYPHNLNLQNVKSNFTTNGIVHLVTSMAIPNYKKKLHTTFEIGFISDSMEKLTCGLDSLSGMTIDYLVKTKCKTDQVLVRLFLYNDQFTMTPIKTKPRIHRDADDEKSVKRRDKNSNLTYEQIDAHIRNNRPLIKDIPLIDGDYSKEISRLLNDVYISDVLQGNLTQPKEEIANSYSTGFYSNPKQENFQSSPLNINTNNSSSNDSGNSYASPSHNINRSNSSNYANSQSSSIYSNNNPPRSYTFNPPSQRNPIPRPNLFNTNDMLNNKSKDDLNIYFPSDCDPMDGLDLITPQREFPYNAQTFDVAYEKLNNRGFEGFTGFPEATFDPVASANYNNRGNEMYFNTSPLPNSSSSHNIHYQNFEQPQQSGLLQTYPVSCHQPTTTTSYGTNLSSSTLNTNYKNSCQVSPFNNQPQPVDAYPTTSVFSTSTYNQQQQYTYNSSSVVRPSFGTGFDVNPRRQQYQVVDYPVDVETPGMCDLEIESNLQQFQRMQFP
uniref:BTB domain-containing protein n=1 Tax=Rhabditophanes sp. KR3021 TaxID=114890 RepID=A0AC35UF44_9BILA